MQRFFLEADEAAGASEAEDDQDVEDAQASTSRRWADLDNLFSALCGVDVSRIVQHFWGGKIGRFWVKLLHGQRATFVIDSGRSTVSFALSFQPGLGSGFPLFHGRLSVGKEDTALSQPAIYCVTYQRNCLKMYSSISWRHVEDHLTGYLLHC